jgi:hypothetical protein
MDVMWSSFPRFSSRRGMSQLHTDIDRFLTVFGAISAAFTQLPTELLKSFQTTLSDPIGIALLEYEWTLVEAATAAPHVPPCPGDAPGQGTPGHLWNPTLRVIAMPFELASEPPPPGAHHDAASLPFVYAVYRTSSHRVRTDALTAVDVSCLAAMETDPAGHQLDATWLHAAQRRGLVVPLSPSSGTPHVETS